MSTHSFYVPVMGTGFTIDTPIKIAQYGISSVISIVDDMLMERIRAFYCDKTGRKYQKIGIKEEDARARRTTAYLNLVQEIVRENYEKLKSSSFNKGEEIVKYLEMLPENSTLKQAYKKMLNAKDNDTIASLQKWIRENLTVGEIDVNIMTKVDKARYSKDGNALPSEHNLAHAALRGFAESNLESSVVLSAGFNRRLYGYLAKFQDFFPDKAGKLRKKITIKVSDYRSALTQSKFLAKKGLWVSEYRIESGLNCGGHAFATQGYLLGPILDEFAKNRQELVENTHLTYVKALEKLGKNVPPKRLEQKLTVQGGIGNHSEQEFLLKHYKVDATGWGSPFLLAPDVTSVDEETMDLLSKAQEKDLYLSGISPLGVPFNSLRGNTKDREKDELIKAGKPGSPCPKTYLQSSTEYSKIPLCTASSQYQKKKIEDLKKLSLSEEKYKKEYDKIVEKACLCVGLATSAELVNGLEPKWGDGVSVCPGPNMAYYSDRLNLKDMVDHIYGRKNVLNQLNRPNFFIKELNLYLDYLKNLIADNEELNDERQQKYLLQFKENMSRGIEYYKQLFSEVVIDPQYSKSRLMSELSQANEWLKSLFDNRVLVKSS